MNTKNETRPQPPSWRKTLPRLFLVLFGVAVLLFLSAGSLTWKRGWLFMIVMIVAITATILYLRRVNPEIFVARSKIHKETKSWDKVLIGFLSPAFYGIVVVAAIDVGRFKWSGLPWWVVGIGYLLLAAAFWLTAWAQGVNRFFEPGVRIQTERGHHVIDAGPYAFIRHPGYLAASILCVGVALSLGSLWALIPAALCMLILGVRIILEERLLRRELPGYEEYAQRVRFRLIPGIW